jgi:lysophospholipase L1-like esterase
MRTKLAPYTVAVTRWALEQIRDAVASRGARMIVVLLAAPIDPNIAIADFNRLQQMAGGLGVPVIDLRDTFQSRNLYDLQVIPRTDIHPNAKGHQLIFQNLLAKLRAQPDAWSALAGGSSHTGNGGAAASR